MQKTDELFTSAEHNKSTAGPMFVLSLAALIASLAISSINIILPELVSSLDTTFAHVQWVIIAYMLFLTSTLVIAGRFSDMFGRRRLFLTGIVIFTVAAGVGGLSQNLWLLVCARAVQGTGGAILIAVTMAMVSDILPKNKVAPAMGLIGSMSAIGTGAGPVFGGLILDGFSWQLVFLINIPLGILIYLLAGKYLPGDKPLSAKAEASVDYPGIFLLFSAILTYTLSLKLTGNGFDIANLALCSLSLLSLLLFIKVECNSANPLIKLSILKDRELITSLISNFIVSTVVMSSLVIGPFYLVVALELTITQAGVAMAASPLTVAITSSLVGRIANRYDLRKIILTGLFIIMFAAISMTLLKVTYGLLGYLVCLITMAIGYATFLSTNNTLIMTATSSRIRGSVSGILNLSRNLGLLTGASLMSTVFALVSGITDINTANSHKIELGLHAVYQLAIVFLAVAIIVQIIAIRRSGKTLK
ncbi:MFS transporter [Thalassomonas viridans]|uniref:MFS transporter n=1 Tax=Thalassomonas viridans TaxID=137584 RepID=A0AAE9Z699_9GAMM|nr:MFS transporter [Thalassomonas viridans]WDE07057.1 MFS transporter [Thalassomonas viridans]